MLKTMIQEEVLETVPGHRFPLFELVCPHFRAFWQIAPFDLSYAKFSEYDVR